MKTIITIPCKNIYITDIRNLSNSITYGVPCWRIIFKRKLFKKCQNLNVKIILISNFWTNLFSKKKCPIFVTPTLDLFTKYKKFYPRNFKTWTDANPNADLNFVKFGQKWFFNNLPYGNDAKFKLRCICERKVELACNIYPPYQPN